MGEYDDDDRADAYERAINDHFDDVYDEPAGVDPATYIQFANIIHHYDDTARPDHDDIDYDFASVDNLDGDEFNDRDDIDPATAFIFLLAVVDAIEEFGSFDDIPDDYEFGEADYDYPAPDYTRYRFPSYDHFRGPCKRVGRAFFNPRYPGSPPV